jgi:hypothetical protein
MKSLGQNLSPNQKEGAYISPSFFFPATFMNTTSTELAAHII